MGGEFGQGREWNHDRELDWYLLDISWHETLRRWVEDLNKFYRTVPAMHELDFKPEGFEGIDCCDTENTVLSLFPTSPSNPDHSPLPARNFPPPPPYTHHVPF